MFEFRDLTADEIEVRVGTISRAGTGLSLLLYKDARCDMAILDETVGPMNWQRRHYDCKGNLFCGIAINRNYYDTTLEPVWIAVLRADRTATVTKRKVKRLTVLRELEQTGE